MAIVLMFILLTVYIVYSACIIRVMGCIGACIIASIGAFILGNQYKGGPPVYAVR